MNHPTGATPGEWTFQPGEPGHYDPLGPSNLGIPPYIQSTHEGTTIDLATLCLPIPVDPDDTDDLADLSEASLELLGSTEANGELMADAPYMLETIRDLISQVEVGTIIIPTNDTSDSALSRAYHMLTKHTPPEPAQGTDAPTETRPRLSLVPNPAEQPTAPQPPPAQESPS